MNIHHFITRRAEGQYIGTLEGDLPTPCWEIARSEGHWEGYQYRLQLVAADKGGVCTQVIRPFRHEVQLGSLDGGQYCLIVNGQEEWTFWFAVD